MPDLPLPDPRWADLLLALASVLLAVSVTQIRRDLSAVVGFTAYGLLLGLVWVRLGAIDVALTEAALGGGLTGQIGRAHV